MQALKATPDELAAPRIDRFAGLKRTLKFCALALAALLITRLIWGQVTSSRIALRLAEYRSRGEPSDLSEIAPPAIPDEQNAFFYLSKAVQEEVPPDQNSGPIFSMLNDPRTPAQERAGRAWIAANHQTFQDIESALKCKQIAWKMDRTSVPSLTKAIHIPGFADSLVTLSTFDFKDGNHYQAIQRIEQALELLTVTRTSPIWISQNGSQNWHRVIGDQIQQILPTLQIERDEKARGPSGAAVTPATRQQLRHIISLLLDTAPDQAALVRVLCAERLYSVDYNAAAARGDAWKYMYGYGTPTNSLQRLGLWWIAPRYQEHTVTEMDYYTGLIAAAKEPSSKAMTLQLPRTPRPALSRTIAVYPVDRIELSMGDAEFNRWLPNVYLSFKHRCQAAVYLAARHYQADHGTPPTLINQLIPTYLDKTPDDPLVGGPGIWLLSPKPPTPTSTPATVPASQPTTK